MSIMPICASVHCFTTQVCATHLKCRALVGVGGGILGGLGHLEDVVDGNQVVRVPRDAGAIGKALQRQRALLQAALVHICQPKTPFSESGRDDAQL